jgi:hypothetical protein
MNNEMRFTPGGPRPPEKVRMVESAQDLVVPPGGPRYRSEVHRVESGETALFSEETGKRLRQHDAPGPPDQANWITYAGWSNTSGNPIIKFLSTWSVPPAPAMESSQLLYLFNGVEPANGQIIVQPVLQWGDSGADEDGQNRTGPFWTVASWIVGGPDGSASHTPHILVNPGDLLVGAITLLQQTRSGFVYNCEFQRLPSTTLATPEISELVWCVETLEAYELQGNRTPPYDLDAASEYPGSPVTFGSIEIITAGPRPAGFWSASDVVTTHGEHTSIVANATIQGEIAISF